MSVRRRFFGSLGLLLVAAGCADPPSGGLSFEEDLSAWRVERDQALRSPSGYLSLVGLFWLEEGTQTIGSSPACDIPLPLGRGPERVGNLTLTGGVVTFTAEPGAEVTLDGSPVSVSVMASDEKGPPPQVEAGSLTFWIIKRGDWLGVRVQDEQSPLLRSFSGTVAFPADPAWRVTGEFVPDDRALVVDVPNVLGTTYEEEVPGAIRVTLAGMEMELLPTGEPEEGLFLVFGDGTNGDETYGGGRFLRIDPPDSDGHVVLDFNRAYHPPCAFSPFTTCPRPLLENQLPFRVRVGERW